jgi:transposase-like protein
MVKYSYELKRQVIQDYLDGLGGYKKLAQKYGLPILVSLSLMR